MFVIGLSDRWRDIYPERGLLLVLYLIPGARSCQRFASRVELDVRDTSDRLRVSGSTPYSLPLLKSDCVVITWSPSTYTSVGPDCPDALPSPCLLITMWQLIKAHGVTRNELKIHVICYITTTVIPYLCLVFITKKVCIHPILLPYLGWDTSSFFCGIKVVWIQSFFSFS